MSIDHLTRLEMELMQRVRGATGLMEEKSAKLREEGVFDAYCSVFRNYLDLASESACRAEAVKRAVFISWYELTEPPCFTGILGITAGDRGRVLSELNSYLLEANPDTEFQWMLPWYYFITDFAFPELESYEAVQQMLATADSHSWQRSRIDSVELQGRGQMGQYWSRVLDVEYERQMRSRGTGDA